VAAYIRREKARLDDLATLSVEQQRRERAESLRLTQAVLGLDLNGDFSLARLAHWVHTGQELPDPEGDAEVGPDAARWRPGGQR
jgi:hypothetical protein